MCGTSCGVAVDRHAGLRRLGAGDVRGQHAEGLVVVVVAEVRVGQVVIAVEQVRVLAELVVARERTLPGAEEQRGVGRVDQAVLARRQDAHRLAVRVVVRAVGVRRRARRRPARSPGRPARRRPASRPSERGGSDDGDDAANWLGMLGLLARSGPGKTLWPVRSLLATPAVRGGQSPHGSTGAAQAHPAAVRRRPGTAATARRRAGRGTPAALGSTASTTPSAVCATSSVPGTRSSVSAARSAGAT